MCKLKDTQIEQINTLKYDIKPNFKLNIFLAKKDRVDYIYNTSALEGNNMTFPEVQTLLEGITVGGHKLSDEQMILNQNRSVNLLFDLISQDKFCLSKNIHLKLHKEVSKEEALTWGEFRNANVRIGGTEFIPPKWQSLDDIYEFNIKQIQKIKHPINKALAFFLLGAKNQYFFDGNKRTSRLMMNGELLSCGYALFNIKVKDQLEFNKAMLNYYDNDNLVDTLKYLSLYYLEQIDI